MENLRTNSSLFPIHKIRDKGGERHRVKADSSLERQASLSLQTEPCKPQDTSERLTPTKHLHTAAHREPQENGPVRESPLLP